MNKKNHVLQAKLAPTCFATLLALGMVIPVQAAVVAGDTNQPGIHKDANGTTIVDINTASAGGVSHNVFSEFNVDSNGVILNNGGTASNTQLAGQIAGNTNLAGGSAKVILNEVRSSDPSQLNGMVEVAGQSAQVIIANPSGITCDGCGFINTNHATLTTATATFDGQGNVNGLNVNKGQVTITGKGMDTRSVKYTDIIARSVKVNAQLQANELSITTGSNRIDKNGRVQKNYDGSAAPEVALDVSALGSMYANKIYMKGTDAGVGVRIDHADLTATDALSIDVDGVIDNNGGRISGKNAATVMGSSVLNHNGQIVSEGMVAVAGNETVDNTQGTISGDSTSVSGKNILNNAGMINGNRSTTVYADSLNNTAGQLISEGDLSIGRISNAWNAWDATGVINQNGRITSNGALTVDAANLDNTSGQLTSAGSMNVNVNTLTNRNGHISAGSTDRASWNTIFASTLNNDNGLIQSVGQDSQLQIAGNSALSNKKGGIHSDGSLSLNGATDNASGTISADKDITFYGDVYRSDKNSALTAGHNLNMTVTTNFQNAGNLDSGNALSLTLGSNGWNSYGVQAQNSGVINADGRLNLQMNSGVFTNSGTMNGNGIDLQLSDLANNGTVSSKGDLDLYTTSLENNGAGAIRADGNVNLTASYMTTSAGSQILAGKDANLNIMKSLTNDGEISAARDVNLTVTGNGGYSQMTVYNNGKIAAGNMLNANMNRVTLINGGTLHADEGIYINSKNLTNRGDITSTGDVNLNSANGITNDTSGNITGAHVYTTGYVNNMGVINETTAAQNNSSDAADKADQTDAGTANNAVQPNGTPEGDGIWMDGVVYHVGDAYNGYTITYIAFYPGGFAIYTM